MTSTASATPAPSDGLLEDLVDANHILFDRGVVDAFGHVSARHDRRPDCFIISRNMAPGLVSADDLMLFDLDGQAQNGDERRSYLERFIHAEIYRARPEVMAVVHSHSPAVVPFGVVKGARLRPVCHMAGFLGGGPAVFEIREHAGYTSDLLVRSPALGAALAAKLGQAAVVLMRGHGSTVAAATVQQAVCRAVYTETNARILSQALQLGEVDCLTEDEARAANATNEAQYGRPWALWKAQSRAQRPRS